MTFQKGLIQKQYTISIIKEMVRKSIHMCSAFIPFFLKFSKTAVLVCLGIALCLYTISEILRLNAIELPFVAKLTQVAARKRDENRFVLGPVTLVIGIMLAIIWFRPEAAKAGIFALAFGDGLASLCGKLYGRVHIPFTNGKTAEGSLACFLAVYVSSFTVFQNAGLSLFLASVAMIVEVIPMTDFDNIVIPVLIAFLSQYFVCC